MFLKRKKGSALLFVLFLVSLVVMFMGAMMVVNQGSIRLATGLNADKNATANCQSGLDYAWQMLERDSTFGKDPFPNGANCGFNSAQDRIVVRTVNPNGNVQTQSIRGTYQDKENSGFEICISNNLASTATVSLSNAISGPRAIPPRSVLLSVRGFEGKRTRVLEALLEKAPFVSHGLFAGDDVTAQWGSGVATWDVLSNDPFRNSIRTKGKLTVGRVTSGGLKFSPTGNATASTYGRYGAALPSRESSKAARSLTPTAITMPPASRAAWFCRVPPRKTASRRWVPMTCASPTSTSAFPAASIVSKRPPSTSKSSGKPRKPRCR